MDIDKINGEINSTLEAVHKPAVSIILPVYNVEKFLREAIDSLINQTFSNIEILCVDDCSTDKSLQILNEYASKDSRVKVFPQEINRGSGYCRNLAINNAQGEYIMFLDPDDWYELNACELAYNQIKKNGNDFVIFSFSRYFQDTGESRLDKGYLLPYADLINNPHIKLWELTKPFMISAYVWTQIYNRDFIQKNNIEFDESMRMGQDANFYFGAISASNTVSVIDKSLYNYRKHNDSICTSRVNLWRCSALSRVKSYELILKSNHKDEYMRSYVPYYIRCLLLWYNKWTSINPEIDHEYYDLVRKIYRDLDKKYNIKNYKTEINYQRFRKICTRNWYLHRGIKFLDSILANVFAIKNSDDKSHKIITLFGFKLKLRRK